MTCLTIAANLSALLLPMAMLQCGISLRYHVASGQYIDVPSIAQAVLIGVAAHFSAADVELPDRQVIAPGATREISWDCPAVVVSLAGIGWGQSPGSGSSPRPTGNPTSVGGARHAVVNVQIIRHAVDSDGEAADPEVLTDAGLTTMKDAALLSQALVELCGQGGSLRQAGVTATAGAVESLGPTDFTAVEGSVIVTAKNLA